MKVYNKLALLIPFSLLALYYLLESNSSLQKYLPNPVNLILTLTILASFAAFNKPSLSVKAIFDKNKILRDKQYYRLLTHGFLHVDLFHLFINGFTFYNFAPFLYRSLSAQSIHGGTIFLAIYLLCIVLASIPDLKYKKGDYYAVGASGAISALLAIVVLLYPKMKMGIILLPISLPGPLFITLFIAISYKLSKGNSKIGHLTHLSGAVAGLLIGILLKLSLYQ